MLTPVIPCGNNKPEMWKSTQGKFSIRAVKTVKIIKLALRADKKINNNFI